MRNALDKGLRSKLEKTVIAAREIAETAVTEVLSRLGVGDATAPDFLDESQRKLRNQLRAHGRQLGDRLEENGSQQITHLVAEMAYEHWHRMLFARFLEQNNLLMYDAYTSITLEDCAELAEEEPDCANAWELAGRLAAKMLPQIFRVDSPVFSVKLAINHVKTLEAMLAELDPEIFQAQDSLGWCYQFWQSQRKKEVNDSGVKIGADELSPVTQLFTEPYMVAFLLDNSLGAWWAKRRLTQDQLRSASNEQELRDYAAIDGIPLSNLRFVKTEHDQIELWKPASGWFDGWPAHITDLKILDPCCGSGHFLVALFLMLVPMRMSLENIDVEKSIDLVLMENIHGLELDKRCVELAYFALSLEAWRYSGSSGYRKLPELNIACSGINITEVDFSSEKKISTLMQNALFSGSLIDPANDVVELFDVYASGVKNKKNADNEIVKSLENATKALKLLSKKYQFVVTNVPYLTRSKFCQELRCFAEINYSESMADLATMMIDRFNSWLSSNGCFAVVSPQNWLFQPAYLQFRKMLLTRHRWLFLAKLGFGSFVTPLNAAPTLFIASNCNKHNSLSDEIFTLDVSGQKSIDEKQSYLVLENMGVYYQNKINDDYILMSDESNDIRNLHEFVDVYQGIRTGDKPRFVQQFWENKVCDNWDYLQSSSNSFFWGGMSQIVRWEKGKGQLHQYAEETRDRLHDMHESGNLSWGKRGVTINQMGGLESSLYSGEKYDGNCATLTPTNSCDFGAVWTYCSSNDYKVRIRNIDSSLKVTNATLGKAAFDELYWKKQYELLYPNGLPKPFTNDFTQWVFHGHPCASVIWDEQNKWTKEGTVRFDDTVLQVAVARLLGYQWPAELDKDMELAAEQRELVHQATKLNALADDDGIVCLPAVRGEKPAHIRLESMLIAAYEDDWSADTLHKLLSAVGSKDLETWLRDKFFEQHCKLFQHRPFIWQIWDGLKDGFSVLVNYHKLDYAGLERLIYTYLGDWIRIQEQGTKEGIDGAEARLIAARNLQKTLEAILAGEAPLDIFVRWKPLEEQPIGWNPDLNDGVRLNIRPFMLAPAVGKKDAGILRAKPNINWKKDRGNDVESAPWYTLGLEYGETVGSRINDHHLTLAEKREAREKVTKEGS